MLISNLHIIYGNRQYSSNTGNILVIFPSEFDMDYPQGWIILLPDTNVHRFIETLQCDYTLMIDKS